MSPQKPAIFAALVNYWITPLHKTFYQIARKSELYWQYGPSKHGMLEFEHQQMNIANTVFINVLVTLKENVNITSKCGLQYEVFGVIKHSNNRFFPLLKIFLVKF